MNVQIMKRLKAAEESLAISKMKDIPDQVSILYREAEEDYFITENFFNHDSSGRCKGIKKRKTQVVKVLHDYVIAADFSGTIFLENFYPEAVLFLVGEKELKEIRKQSGNGSFSFESIAKDGAVAIWTYHDDN